MRALRVSFYNRSYYPDRGATGQLLAELAETLVRDFRCEVSVVAGPPLRECEEAGALRSWQPIVHTRAQGVDVLRTFGTTLPARHFVARACNYVTYFLAACLVALRDSRRDVVVAYTDPPIIGLAGLLAAWRSRAAFVYVCQDVFPEVARLLEDFRSPVVDWFLDRVNRLLLRRAERVITVGERMRERLVAEKAADPERVVVIHNWADCTAIRPAPKLNGFSQAHGLADSFVVMHSGNVGLAQDLDTLLSAAARLRGCSEVVVAIVGEGTKRSALEARVQSEGLDNVRFVPRQPRDRVIDSFAAADVFVIGLRKGLIGYLVPSKLYGILAAGRPYVAAVEDDSEVAAITRKYDCGLLVEPGDVEALAGAILRLHRDTALRARLGTNARAAALDFDRARQVAAYHEVLQEAADAFERGSSRGPLGKHALDVVLSGLGLVIAAPLCALIALLIKMEDGGPIFFSQERVGLEGRRFRSWKFRSMVPDADRRFGLRQASERDPRVTRVGRWLRTTAMDELPQLWNILRGDMSFVGPRALVPSEIEVSGSGSAVALDRIPGYERRHRVRPGLTGIAQIYAPRDIPRRQKFRYDGVYILRQSLWLDVRLIALSFWITFRGTWESRGRKF